MNNTVENIAVVTGATGFIGSNLTKRLLDDGWEVHLIVRPGSGLEQIQGISNKVNFHKYDGSVDCLADTFKSVKPTVVFHLASLFIAQHETKDIEPLIKSNLLFPTQLIEAMTLNDVFNLINTGTSWQHFEDNTYSPVCLYAATKQSFEAILQFYIETTNLKTITLKLFDTYGPDDPRPKLIPLLGKLAKGQHSIAMSPGEQLIDILYIDDVIDAYMIAAGRLLANEAEKSESYALSSAEPVNLKELVAIYSQVVNKELPIDWGSRSYRSREVMIPWSKGKPLPGWKPKVGLKEGIKKVIKKC